MTEPLGYEPYISERAVQTDRRCPACRWVLYREPAGWFDDEYDPPIHVCPVCGWNDEVEAS